MTTDSDVELQASEMAPKRSVNYRLTHRCRDCGNENTSEAARDWDDPPVVCRECGEKPPSGWEQIHREALKR